MNFDSSHYEHDNIGENYNDNGTEEINHRRPTEHFREDKNYVT